jgi:hypothetical protein
LCLINKGYFFMSWYWVQHRDSFTFALCH